MKVEKVRGQETRVFAGHVAARLARQIEVSVATVDLSLSQYRLLSLLSAGSSAPSALASNLSVRPPSITAVVDGLVARGLVSRHHDQEEDRRRVTHVVTDEGLRLLAEADAAVEAKLAEITAHLDRDDAARAYANLELWQQALDVHRAAKRSEADGKDRA